MARSLPVLQLALVLSAASVSFARAGHQVTLFRPLLADPRENQFRMKFVRYTEDWRYGTDITDPASAGGYANDRSEVSWDVGIGSTLRMNPWRKFGAWQPPLAGYQLVTPAGVFANFDRVGSELINADYQFGVGVDIVWSGNLEEVTRDQGHEQAGSRQRRQGKKIAGIQDFDRPMWTSQFLLYHRSAHIGDEYLALGDFGTNQDGHPAQGELFAFPPVKRVNLSFEAFRAITSVEWTPGGGRGATLRAYAGGELKLNWFDRLEPRNFNSAIAQAGLEFRSKGNRDDLGPTPWLGWLTGPFGETVVSEWIAAVDLKLARPFNFASCDNAASDTEVWTPHLWSRCPHGREYDAYAGSWHAMVGGSFYLSDHRNREEGGRRVGPEFVVAWDFYNGYSPNGQFLDQRLRYWGVAPSITIHF